ncbi:MAG: alpha-ketoglutarate-dependent dioxygenase AlkB [bacterium]|nr:alpha-ketoglutarate-dependent dioxygenase AlkB [bacterium]
MSPTTPPGKRLDLPDAEVWLCEGWLARDEAARLFEALVAATAWRQEPIRMFGRTVMQPRLLAWHGDPDATYTYSGVCHEPEPWTPDLSSVRERLLPVAGDFNSVLLNLYRDGRDRMGWHADDERELGPEPVIASVSLGETRRFLLRHRTRRELDTVAIALSAGDLLVMKGATQHRWKHAVPGTAMSVGSRLNLTFRRIHPALRGGKPLA